MAKSRMLGNKISMSERVNALPGEGPLLYTWMIPHLDKYGRMKALDILIKNTVFPLRRATLKNIKHWLDCMEENTKDGLGLIVRYEVDGKKYLYMPGFDTEQKPQTKPKPGQKDDDGWRGREGDSGIPAPPFYKPGMLTHEIPLKPSDEIPSPPPDDIPEPELDKKKGEVYKCFEDNISMLTPMIAEEMDKHYKKYGYEKCMYAIRESANQGKRSLAYITAILEGRGKKPSKTAAKASPFDDRVTE